MRADGPSNLGQLDRRIGGVGVGVCGMLALERAARVVVVYGMVIGND